MENLKSKWKIWDQNGKFEIKMEKWNEKSKNWHNRGKIWDQNGKNETKQVKTDTIVEKFEIKWKKLNETSKTETIATFFAPFQWKNERYAWNFATR